MVSYCQPREQTMCVKFVETAETIAIVALLCAMIAIVARFALL